MPPFRHHTVIPYVENEIRWPNFVLEFVEYVLKHSDDEALWVLVGSIGALNYHVGVLASKAMVIAKSITLAFVAAVATAQTAGKLTLPV